jgi:hypothetical protein
VVSTAAVPIAFGPAGVMRVTNGAVPGFGLGKADDAVEDDAAPFNREIESCAVVREPGLGLDTGNNSCETAITTSERNRARKKRLSIQGTGS